MAVRSGHAPGGQQRVPQQGRARLTVEKILAAAVNILVEDGLPGLNTNRVAERAGVNISTLYSYFPDKLAILRELGSRFQEKRTIFIEERGPELAAGADWAAWFTMLVDRMVLFRLEEPGGLAIRQASLATPELRYLDEASTDRVTDAKVPGLMAHCPSMDKDQACLVARTTTEISTALLDRAFQETPYDAGQIAELKRALIAYLATYLDPPPVAPPSTPRRTRKRNT